MSREPPQIWANHCHWSSQSHYPLLSLSCTYICPYESRSGEQKIRHDVETVMKREHRAKSLPHRQAGFPQLTQRKSQALNLSAGKGLYDKLFFNLLQL